MTALTTPTAPPARRPTPRQLEVLQYVFDYWCQHLTPPSLRDCMLEFGLGSSNGAACHIRALVKAGLIARPDGSGTARAFVVLGLREAVAESAERYFRDLLDRLERGEGV